MATEKQATQEQVRKLAYSIWEREGRPQGRDVEHYYKAKGMLDERKADAVVIEPQPAPTAKGKGTFVEAKSGRVGASSGRRHQA